MNSAMNHIRAGINVLEQSRLNRARQITYIVLACVVLPFVPNSAAACRNTQVISGAPKGLDKVDQSTWQRILVLRSETEVNALRDALDDPSWQMRFVAMDQLARKGRNAIDAFDDLADVLANDKSPLMRSHAARAIRRLGADSERVAAALSQVPEARRAAARAQGSQSSSIQVVSPPRRLVAVHHPDVSPGPVTGVAADQATLLNLIQQADMQTASATARAWLGEDAPPWRQRLALEHLPHILPFPEAQPRIIRLLGSTDVDVCRAAIRATRRYGDVGDVFLAPLLKRINDQAMGLDFIEALSNRRALPASAVPMLTARFEAEITRAQGCANNGHYGNSCRTRLQIVAHAVIQADPEAAMPGLGRMLDSSCHRLALTAGQLLQRQNEWPEDVLEQVLARATVGKQEERLQWLAMLLRHAQFDLELVCNIMDDFAEPDMTKAMQYARRLGNYTRQSATLRDALLEGFKSDNPNIRLGCTLALANVPQLKEPRVRAALHVLAIAAAPQDRALYLGQLHLTEQMQGPLPASQVVHVVAAAVESRQVAESMED